MSKKIMLLGLAIILLSLASPAQQGNFGLGVIVGEPTGLSWKIWTGRTTALAGAAAWSFGENDAFHLHLDYVFHNFSLIRVNKGRMPFYYGIGARVLFHEKEENETIVGIRFPLGFEYFFEKSPLAIFLEIVPILDIAPGTDFDLNAGLGLRFYF